MRQVLACLFILLFVAGTASADETVQPKLYGAFLQGGIADSWDTKGWNNEISGMRNLGLEAVILQDCRDEWLEPGGLVDKMIATCEERQFSYYIGTSEVVAFGFQSNYPTAEWFARRLPADNRRVNNVAARVKGRKHFKGWYLSLEVHSSYEDYEGVARASAQNYFAPLTAEMKRLSPSASVVIAPFANTRKSASWTGEPDIEGRNLAAMLDILLEETKIDVVAPQDCLGTDKARIAGDAPTLLPYFRSIKETVDKHSGAQLWADIETFTLPSTEIYAEEHGPQLEKLLGSADLEQLRSKFAERSFDGLPRPVGSWKASMDLLAKEVGIRRFIAFAYNPYILYRDRSGAANQTTKTHFYETYRQESGR